MPLGPEYFEERLDLKKHPLVEYEQRLMNAVCEHVDSYLKKNEDSVRANKRLIVFLPDSFGSSLPDRIRVAVKELFMATGWHDIRLENVPREYDDEGNNPSGGYVVVTLFKQRLP